MAHHAAHIPLVILDVVVQRVAFNVAGRRENALERAIAIDIVATIVARSQCCEWRKIRIVYDATSCYHSISEPKGCNIR